MPTCTPFLPSDYARDIGAYSRPLPAPSPDQRRLSASGCSSWYLLSMFCWTHSEAVDPMHVITNSAQRPLPRFLSPGSWCPVALESLLGFCYSASLPPPCPLLPFIVPGSPSFREKACDWLITVSRGFRD